MWLVKWFLLIPHAVVLAFLWLGYVLLWPVVLVTVVVTGRYPRGIFEYQVGVLRWTWRVAYYGYGALGTDVYPPFTLQDVPEYPARLDVAYPEQLSRGLALVKWWLLAIPHYVVVALLTGPQVRWEDAEGVVQHQNQTGLIGVLVLVVGVVLLFSGRYPGGLHDLLVGLNRWLYRVGVYVSLMTDQYPPFRLDMGPGEPTSVRG
ncbi:DUF4389 domain-containing protein [Actinotalea sp. Marseille-Q4924]|uniref:DUF4389 domain-containing protein n=1 Tax=Actinotalea sp. Marseille-Q4924 TaxID=2866571 RepID=UPI001CE468D2|nr:DUF4389 domain-containing protein [Actinotalea sp. Marseille-Q4924]